LLSFQFFEGIHIQEENALFIALFFFFFFSFLRVRLVFFGAFLVVTAAIIGLAAITWSLCCGESF
jgi:hypothetical protein